MVTVREAFDADTVLGGRVDTVVGVEFGLQQRRLDWLLIEHLLEPMVVTTRTYKFDEAVFDQHYGRFDAGLRADSVRFIEFIPLNGFTSDLTELELPDGLVVRPMTDQQISRAIHVLAVPAEFSGGPNSVQVSRFHQWALTKEQCYSVRSYKTGMPERPQAPPFPSLEESARRLVTALRVVCGGSVVATRPIHAQHDDDFPGGITGSAVLTAIGAADINRPTLLLANDHVDAVRSYYEMLMEPAVVQDRSLQVALRRFVFAGSRSLPEDRLIDLNICAEVLFIKRGGLTGHRKAKPVAAAAHKLLANDPVLKVDGAEIERFIEQAYKLRNAEIHGDSALPTNMNLLGGEETRDLTRFVEDLTSVLSRAIHLTLVPRQATLGR